MKSEKGITLTSLIIYIIVLTVVIATVSVITGNARKEIKDTKNKVNNEEYLKLTQYLTEDLNSINFKKIIVAENNEYIQINFLGGETHIYRFKDNTIYYIVGNTNEGSMSTFDKEIALCTKIDNCTFTKETNKLKVQVTVNNITYNNNYFINEEDNN